MEILLGAVLIAVVIFAMRGGSLIILVPLAVILSYFISSLNEQKNRRKKAALKQQRKFDDRQRMDIKGSGSVAPQPRPMSPFEMSLQRQFREDLVIYATLNYPNVNNSPQRLPDHLKQAYESGNPNDLPSFGESRSELSDYFYMAKCPDPVTSADEFVEQVLKDCRDLCDFHRLGLSQEKRRLVRKDAYGNVFASEWWSESKGARYFVDAVIVPSIGQGRWSKAVILSRMSKSHQAFYRDVLRIIDKAADDFAADDICPDQLDGFQYEDFCERTLRESGWNVLQTAQSGDQGVDLIAEKGDMRVCIQCKRYSSPVGNSAVQEVATGKMYWKGTHAAVVSSANFTSSAKDLAESASVLLLHHADLKNLELLLSNASSGSST